MDGVNNTKKELIFSHVNIDVNGFDFYNESQDQINCDLALIKKDVRIINDLRITAAEKEVETALLYHAELWYVIEDLKVLTNEITHGHVDVDAQHTSVGKK